MNFNRDMFIKSMAIIGIVLHLAFLLARGRIAQYSAEQVWERMWQNEEYIPPYEGWESDVNYGVLTAGTACCVYVPAALVTGIVTIVSAYEKQRQRVLCTIGITLGILTLIYMVIWMCAAS